MTVQVVATLSNRESLCICEITSREVELASTDDSMIDGNGLYLVSVDNRNPRGDGQVLAKFTTEEAALKLAQFFRLNGRLEQVA